MRWAVVALLALLAGCGDGGGGDDTRLVVSAASSLSKPLTACSKTFEGADVRLSFAGSDELAAQIRQGVKPDVYAAANTKLPAQLAQEGLLGEPVKFATNELVIAAPADSDIASVADLGRHGVKLAIGAESVPVGSYTRQVLAFVPGALRNRIIANVRSEEPDVKGVVGKLTQGAADAGFVYRTDIVDGLQAIALPKELQPTVAYGAGVVQGTKHAEPAERYLDGLTDGACADALRDAGFGPPPGG